MSDIVFVFGSNLAGRHGRGSAAAAKQRYGAKHGVGVGRCGQSYAIPTKDEKLKVLSLSSINKYIQSFIQYACEHSDTIFQVVEIGTGLAGYKHEQIAPMFKNAPRNCLLSKRWCNILDRDYVEWES